MPKPKGPTAGRREPRRPAETAQLKTVEVSYLDAYERCAGDRVLAWYSIDPSHAAGDAPQIARCRGTQILASIRRKAPELLTAALERIADLGKDIAEGEMSAILMDAEAAVRIKGVELMMRRHGWEAPRRVDIQDLSSLQAEVAKLAEATDVEDQG